MMFKRFLRRLDPQSPPLPVARPGLVSTEYPMRTVGRIWVGLGHDPAFFRASDLQLGDARCLICAALALFEHGPCASIPDPHLWTAPAIGVRVTTTAAGHELLGQLAAWGAQHQAMPAPWPVPVPDPTGPPNPIPQGRLNR